MPAETVAVNLALPAELDKQVRELIRRHGLEPRTWRQSILREAIARGLPAVAENIAKTFAKKSAA